MVYLPCHTIHPHPHTPGCHTSYMQDMWVGHVTLLLLLFTYIHTHLLLKINYETPSKLVAVTIPSDQLHHCGIRPKIAMLTLIAWACCVV